MYLVILANTRHADFSGLTPILQSSTYLTKLGLLLPVFLSSSSNMMLVNKGFNGLPCGVHSMRWLTLDSIIPRWRNSPIRRKTPFVLLSFWQAYQLVMVHLVEKLLKIERHYLPIPVVQEGLEFFTTAWQAFLPRQKQVTNAEKLGS